MNFKKHGKKSILISSILAITLCLAIVIGGTVALFSSKQEIGGVATSGTVKVAARLDNLKTYSGVMTSATAWDYEEQQNGAFSCGGSAALTGGQISITNMAPMDKVETTLTITNTSSINSKVQVSIMGTEVEDKKLFDSLSIGFRITTGPNDFYGNFANNNGVAAYSNWIALPANTNPTCTITIIIEMDDVAEQQGGQLNLKIGVTAVQSNAYTQDNQPWTPNA